MRDYVWAVRVTAMPEGSVLEDGSFNPAWTPAGWGEEMASLKRAGIMRPEETDFFWPAMDKVWMSRSTAAKRAKLLERYGATAEVVRSPLKWEAPGSVADRVERRSDLGGVVRIELDTRLLERFSNLLDAQLEEADGHAYVFGEKVGVLRGFVSSVKRFTDSLETAFEDVCDGCLHDSSPSVGGCGDPQPTEGEARKGGDAA